MLGKTHTQLDEVVTSAVMWSETVLGQDRSETKKSVKIGLGLACTLWFWF